RAGALEAGRVVERGERDEAGRHTGARVVDVADLAVLADRHVRRAGRDVQQRVGARSRAALDVVAVLGDQVAGAVGGEVARAGVLDRARVGGRRARGGGARGDTEEPVALDRDVVRVARGLQGARLHQVVDRAQLGAEADLGGVRATVTTGGAGGTALQLR